MGRSDNIVCGASASGAFASDVFVSDVFVSDAVEYGGLKTPASTEPEILRSAAELAIARASATNPHHQIRIQDSIRWLAESGFARHSDGTLDAGCLADAAVSIGAMAAAGSPRRSTADDTSWVV